MKITDIPFADVANAVQEGLSKTPKQLPSWMFYDRAGDLLFRDIMDMPEYYLTSCEREIIETNKGRLLHHFNAKGTPFRLVELGAGDGTKTEIILQHFTEQGVAFTYVPVDISENALAVLIERLAHTLPALHIQPVNAKYEQAVAALKENQMHNVFLFMGANIGNFQPQEACQFIKLIADAMQIDDQLLIGFDLKKDPRLILAAYNDPQGITRDFNLNLLTRLNRELDAEFDQDQFQHCPSYNPETGMTQSYLVSRIPQDVYIGVLDKTVHFDQWETIYTEISLKYDNKMIRQLAAYAGLEIMESFYDSRLYFCDVLFRKV